MWTNSQFPVDLVTFNEDILMENFSFCAVVGANLVPIAVQFSEKNFESHKEEIKS